MTERDHTPVNYQVAKRTLFGVTPTTAVAVLALLALAAGVVFLAGGQMIAGLLLLLGALFLAALFLEQALHRRESAVDRAAAGVVDRSRALAGFAVSSTRAWTGASRELTRLRLELRRLDRERTQLLVQLGGAAYAENETEVKTLQGRVRELDARSEQCEASARAVIDRARRRTSNERLAVASTEIREPGDARS
jgi:HAMP domain-containing protein